MHIFTITIFLTHDLNPFLLQGQGTLDKRPQKDVGLKEGKVIYLHKSLTSWFNILPEKLL